MTATYYSYDFADQVQPVELDSYYWLNGQRLSRAFCRALRASLADLLDIVMAVYAADRRSPRSFKGAAAGHRRISVRIGVRNPGLWSAGGMAERLHDLLYWLSEDEWSLHFVQRLAAPSAAESENFLFQMPPRDPVTVSLFSGGLDSLAGLAAHAPEGSGGSRVLVSGYTNNRLRHQQRAQVDLVRAAWGHSEAFEHTPEVHHVAVPFGIRKPIGHQEEKSQRTRSLVFLTLGVVTALQGGADTLWVYENGVGALNLPMNETQLGMDNSRGVHPRSLVLAEDLVSMALEQSVRIRNPFLFSTKAQMCKALTDSGFADAVSYTVSCDGFPQRMHNQPSQCGRCTSCILRRQSLQASGLAQHDQGYRYDVLRPQTIRDECHLYDFEAMRGQVHKIGRCLATDDPWRSLCASFPELARTHAELVVRGGLGDRTSIGDGMVDLYRSYAWEWGWSIDALIQAA